MEEIIITKNGRLLPFNLLIDYGKTSLPLMPEAVDAVQSIAGADGELVLATTYGARPFELVAVTDDYLSPVEKEEKREQMRQFLNSIKDKFIKLRIEPMNRTFRVKYSGLASDTNLPKCVEFTIPLKSTDSYAISNETYKFNGVGNFKSNTVKNVGCVITMVGPLSLPSINFNGKRMTYNNTVIEGHKLIINTKNYTIVDVNSSGVATNVMAYFNHVFPKVVNGTNTVSINTGVEATQMYMEWNDLLL